MSEIFTLGIDVGSTASKCIILKDGKEIVGKSLIDVGAGTSGPNRAIEAVLEDAGLKKEDMAFTLATGYGRTSLMDGIADKQMSELSCHAKGAYFLFPKVHTVIDIGGQDVKVLRVEDGVMTNFQMNDKCAAGTGRFLEMMAKTMEMSLDELSQVGLSYQEDITISSMCTVFAESEVVSLIAQNKATDDIVHGLNKAVAVKTAHDRRQPVTETGTENDAKRKYIVYERSCTQLLGTVMPDHQSIGKTENNYSHLSDNNGKSQKYQRFIMLLIAGYPIHHLIV